MPRSKSKIPKGRAVAPANKPNTDKPSPKKTNGPDNISANMPQHQPTTHDRHVRRWSIVALIVEIIVIVVLIAYGVWISRKQEPTKSTAQQATTTPAKQSEPTTGKLLSDELVTTYNSDQTLATIRQTTPNYDRGSATVDKRLIRYTSSDGKTDSVPIYARVYLPQGADQNLPLLVFAPGTTGIGDDCAASLEQPQRRNWANYDSHMLAYAAQGFAVVITDYEGMRDPDRIHHYMVGELEGRAMLDAARAVRRLDAAKAKLSPDVNFVAGYSQGGHAAYWADQIQPSYAPDVPLRGSIGFGPVTDVEQTLADINHGANINWFGPYVLVSYSDWYQQLYPTNRILQPRWITNLRADVLRECIDRVNQYWPNNVGVNRTSQVYTSEFLQALQIGLRKTVPYKQLAEDMYKNIVGNIKTNTPKLLNQGQHDNVILPAQSSAAKNRFCQSGNIVKYSLYDTSRYAVIYYDSVGKVDHYRTMSASLFDTIAWMKDRIAGQTAPTSCQ